MPPSAPPTVGNPPAGASGRKARPARQLDQAEAAAVAAIRWRRSSPRPALACHGNSIAKGPVGPSLFDAEWLHGGDDDAIVKSIKDGYPEKGMPAFKDQMTDPEIWQMVAYIRTQAANLKDKPVYVPDPDGQIIKSEKQTFKMEILARNLETPWALAFLPDGRLLVTERPGRIRIVDKDGKMEPDGGEGAPEGVGEAGRRPLRRRGASRLREGGQRLDLHLVLRAARRLDAAAAARSERGAAGPRRPGQGGRGRGPSNDPPSMTVIMRGRLKNNEFVDQQVLFRAPKELYSQSNAHYGSRFLFDKQNHLFFTLGEKMQMTNAQDLSKPTGKIHRINDDGTMPKDNPYVGQAERRGRRSGATAIAIRRGSRGIRSPASCGNRSTARPAATRSTSSSRSTTTAGASRPRACSRASPRRSEPGMDDPIRYWTPSVAPSGIVVLHRRQVSRLEEQPVRRAVSRASS